MTWRPSYQMPRRSCDEKLPSASADAELLGGGAMVSGAGGTVSPRPLDLLREPTLVPGQGEEELDGPGMATGASSLALLISGGPGMTTGRPLVQVTGLGTAGSVRDAIGAPPQPFVLLSGLARPFLSPPSVPGVTEPWHAILRASAER